MTRLTSMLNPAPPAAGGMTTLITRFLEHLHLERNDSPHTRRAYEGDLRRFLAFLADYLGKEPEMLRPQDVEPAAVRRRAPTLTTTDRLRIFTRVCQTPVDSEKGFSHMNPGHDTRCSPFRRLIATFVLLASWVGSPVFAAEPPKAATLPIVERSIAFHGGDTFRRSRISLSICSRSGCFSIQARHAGPLFDYVVEGEVRGKRRKVRWTNDPVARSAGQEGDTIEEWLGGVATPLDTAGRQSAQDFVSARVYFPFLPFRLADASAWKQDLGLETWGERQLHKVKVTFTPGSSTDAGDEYLYWFDLETGRLEQFAYSFGRGERGGLRFRRGLDYRTVGGILFFDQENLGVDGGRVEVDVITPAYVAETMKPISKIEHKDVKVEPLGANP